MHEQNIRMREEVLVLLHPQITLEIYLDYHSVGGTTDHRDSTSCTLSSISTYGISNH
jgi:hypothetical protein